MRRVIWWTALLAATCLAGCTQSRPVATVRVLPPADGGESDAGCDNGLTLCPLLDGGVTCADTTSDPSNCGSCGFRCPQNLCGSSRCITDAGIGVPDAGMGDSGVPDSGVPDAGTPGPDGGTCLPAPSFGAAQWLPAPVAYGAYTTPFQIAAADFNQDGIQDLVTSGGGLLFGLADGGMQAGTPLLVSSSAHLYLSTADLNNDGYPDVVLLGLGTIDLFINQHDGTFSINSLGQYDGGWIFAVGIADFDGDGRVDLAACSFGGIQLFFDDGTDDGGTPSFLAPISLSTDHCWGLTVLLSGGPASLASIDYLGQQVTIRPGLGDGGFLAPTAYGVATDAGFVGRTLTSADLNRDGLPDLVEGGLIWGIIVYLNSGGDTFAPGILTPGIPGSSAYNVAVADMNGDGYPDILTGGNGGADVQLFLNDCGGGFPSSAGLDAGVDAPSAIAAYRLVNATLPSVATADANTGQVVLIHNLMSLPDGGDM